MSNKEEIKQRILEGAKDLFAKYGFNRVKTDDLANQLGISKRTIYEHFPSKESLFEEVINLELQETKSKLDAIVYRIEHEEKVNFIEELQNLLDLSLSSSYTFSKEFFGDVKKYIPHAWKKIICFDEELKKANTSKIAEYGKRQGYFKDDINYDVVFLMHDFIFQNMLDPNILATLPLTARDAVRIIYDVMFTGVLTDKGRH
ncbi:MAG: TetR/AcrR family transcriptional regulator [Bacteroidetes bacterium]|nr:TetR/AcrR family transcriptional regulator [Bacteroidota bacterium]